MPLLPLRANNKDVLATPDQPTRPTDPDGAQCRVNQCYSLLRRCRRRRRAILVSIVISPALRVERRQQDGRLHVGRQDSGPSQLASG